MTSERLSFCDLINAHKDFIQPNESIGSYLMDLFDFENRIKYLEWMIKQYCNKK